MVPFWIIGTFFVVLFTQSFAATIPPAFADLVRRADASSTTASTSTTSRVPDSECTNGPTSRACWGGGFSIATDFDTKHPTTGKTNHYTLEISNVTDCAEYMSKGIGDGFCRPMLLINGQFPGPTLTGNWGDYFEVTVVNKMQDNGTSIHWHGIRQLNTNQHDGANGITECPIPPGKSHTYRFQATQFGVSWYHSHHSAQYGDGIAGPLVINGPATANYDIDLGPLPLSETYDETAWTKNSLAIHSPAPPLPLNVLVNGSMVNSTGGGQYTTITVTKGKKYRLRLINISVDTYFVFSMDGHDFEVIAADFVPIHPIQKTSIMIGIGQRYDIVFTADQDDGSNYWMRTDIASCSTNAMTTAAAGTVLGAVLHYDQAGTALPTTASATGIDKACNDPSGLQPYWETNVPRDEFAQFFSGLNLTFNGATSDGLVQWYLNDSAMDIDWSKPTLQYVLDGDTSYEKSQNIYHMDQPGKWYFWVIHNTAAVPIEHPIHIHGHDFYILKAGVGDWDGNLDDLVWDNPPRRDVAIMPGSATGGHLLVAFPADNPGAWLMHCHIAWHVTDGLSVQFLESADQILGTIGDISDMQQTCADWKAYEPYWEREKGDSGL
ncbi:laccase-1 precursor [Phyllosticta citrichinensis]